MDRLRALEVFHAVATRRSFTDAARAAHLSQPAVSRSVRELERALGTSLFERTTRSVVLTPQGQELLAIAEDVLGTYGAAMARFDAFRDGERGSIVVAALPSVAASLLPGVLGQLLRARPGIQVEILDVTSTEATDHVRSGRADVAIAEPASADDLHVRPLLVDRMIAVLPTGHRLAGRSTVSWEDLAGEPFIAMSRGSSVRHLTDLAFLEAGVAPSTLIEARNISTAGGMVSAGLGVSAMPELAMPQMSLAPVAARDLGDPPISRRIASVTRSRSSLAAPVALFLEMLHDGPA